MYGSFPNKSTKVTDNVSPPKIGCIILVDETFNDINYDIDTFQLFSYVHTRTGVLFR